MTDYVEFLDELLPPDWEHNADMYGSSFTLICPDGYEIEQDGICPDGHVSPLREAGLI